MFNRYQNISNCIIQCKKDYQFHFKHFVSNHYFESEIPFLDDLDVTSCSVIDNDYRKPFGYPFYLYSHYNL